jgi:SIR2-like domain
VARLEKKPDENPSPQISLDGIFHLLQREYGRKEVNELVAGELESPTGGDAVGLNHKTISRISCDPAGQPQIVTTNFDTLFEGGEDANTTFHVPPSLPDIDRYVPITGITYLHGRREDGPASENPYILSSSDFGRAYLSEGWATTFVRSLLRSYTVVLVGYQAEDPPVKYLLQGLNQDEASDRSNLFAFDRGSRVQVESKWRDRGVTAALQTATNGILVSRYVIFRAR